MKSLQYAKQQNSTGMGIDEITGYKVTADKASPEKIEHREK